MHVLRSVVEGAAFKRSKGVLVTFLKINYSRKQTRIRTTNRKQHSSLIPYQSLPWFFSNLCRSSVKLISLLALHNTRRFASRDSHPMYITPGSVNLLEAYLVGIKPWLYRQVRTIFTPKLRPRQFVEDECIALPTNLLVYAAFCILDTITIVQSIRIEANVVGHVDLTWICIRVNKRSVHVRLHKPGVCVNFSVNFKRLLLTKKFASSSVISANSLNKISRVCSQFWLNFST